MAAATSPAAASPSGEVLSASLEAGCSAAVLAGLDRLARGAGARLDLGLAFRRPAVSEAADDPVASIDLVGFLSWDAGLGSAFAGAGLRLGFGPALAVTCAWELPLGDARLFVPEASSTVHLAAAAIPDSIIIEALLLEITRSREGSPVFRLNGSISWSAFRVIAIDGEASGTSAGAAPALALAEALSGKAGFAAGFRAGLALEIRWNRGRR